MSAYDVPTGVGSGATAGAISLRRWVNDYWPNTFRDGGIFNPRDVCGNPWPFKCAASAHSEGRAVDFMAPTLGAPVGTVLANTLTLLPGVQEVIWNGHRWSSLTREWRPYDGRSDHRDHVHVAITRAAAALNTFPGTAPTPAPPDDEDDDVAVTPEALNEILAHLRSLNDPTHVDARGNRSRAAVEDLRAGQNNTKHDDTLTAVRELQADVDAIKAQLAGG